MWESLEGFLFLQPSNACISIQLNWLMFTINVRWRHLMKSIIWIKSPSSSCFHLLFVKIRLDPAWIDGTQKSMGWRQDSNPQPPDLIHDALNRRTAVSCLHFSLFVLVKLLKKISKQKLVYPFNFFWRYAKRERVDATVYSQNSYTGQG